MAANYGWRLAADTLNWIAAQPWFQQGHRYGGRVPTQVMYSGGRFAQHQPYPKKALISVVCAGKLFIGFHPPPEDMESSTLRYCWPGLCRCSENIFTTSRLMNAR